MRPIAFVASCLLWCSSLWAQATAIIEGPAERRPGVLVILDGSKSNAQVLKWVMIGAPPDAFFTFEGGKTCVFSWDVPGEYRFVLIAAAPDAAGKLSIAIAEKTVKLTGPTPQPPPNPNPTPGPGPTPTPAPGKKIAWVIRETADQTPEMARMVVAMRTGATQQYLASKGHKLLILDDDGKDETGQVPAAFQKAFEAAKSQPLPALVITDQSTGAVLSVAPLGSNPDFVVEAIKRVGG